MLRFSALLLLMVMLINTAWYYPVTHYHRGQIRREMKRRIKNEIPENQLHIITVQNINDPSIKWMKENKEFRYKGMMYDIVKSRKTDSTIEYYCINDIEETILFDQLDQKVQEQMNHQEEKGQGIPVKKLLKSINGNVYLIPVNESLALVTDQFVHQSVYTFFFSTPVREILTPPPQI
jgi:hypothetical protein